MDPQDKTPLQKVIPKITWFVRLEAQHVREFFFRRRLRSYKRWWNHLAKQAAMSEILTGASQEDEFDHWGESEQHGYWRRSAGIRWCWMSGAELEE